MNPRSPVPETGIFPARLLSPDILDQVVPTLIWSGPPPLRRDGADPIEDKPFNGTQYGLTYGTKVEWF